MVLDFLKKSHPRGCSCLDDFIVPYLSRTPFDSLQGVPIGVGIGDLDTYTTECTGFPETSMLFQFLKVYPCHRAY